MTDKFYVDRIIHTKWRGGGYYQGVVKECIPVKQVCRIQLNDGITRNVPWRDISTELPSPDVL